MLDANPGEQIRHYRLEQAAALLRSQKPAVAEVAYAVGFNDHTHFTRSFKQKFGMSPTEYLKQAH
ncbi:MAG: helix-turn-helix transcriptional regulator [Cytophagales bacterium]|nr:helix-turn-helix transcriptional regulator [Cytophagales bacterium]